MPTSPLPPDPYKVLGVGKDADISAIRGAHRKLVLKCHPDKFPDEAQKAAKAEEFHRVQQAYELLSDDKNRERYDAQVRLAELKAERFKEGGINSGEPRRQDPIFSEPVYSPRPSAERSWTTASPIYEEIRPKGAPRYYDEPPRAEPRQSPRREEYRSPRNYEDEYDFVPAFGASKKGSSTTRAPESRTAETSTRARTNWKNVTAKATAEKVKEREAEDRRKLRDKGRRDDGHSKRQNVQSPTYATAASDTDSDVETFMASGRRTERPRSYEDEKSSRRRHESRPSSPDHDARIRQLSQSAAEYIAKSGGKSKSERESESRRRPSISRSQSSNRHQVPPAPPPPPPPMPTMPIIEDAIRASARRGAVSSKSVKSSKRDTPTIEIVDAPSSRRSHHDEPRRPDLPTSKTQPAPIKPPSRSATLEPPRGPERPRGPVRRSATSPLAPLSATQAHKSTKFRDNHDSGYSSPGTPDGHAPKTKTTSYRIVESNESDGDGAPRPHYVLLDPDRDRRPGREASSQRTSSYRGERGGSSRHAPSRSNTGDDGSHHRPANLARAATDRLFGEVPRSPDRTHHDSAHYSRRISKDDVHYSSTRRSPPIDRSSRHDHAYEYERRGSVPIRNRHAQEAN